MKCFDQWFADARMSEVPEAADLLPDGVTEWDGAFFAVCCACGKDDVLQMEVSELPMTGYRHYCNGGPGCQP